MTPFRVLAVCGSLRLASSNRTLLEAAEALVGDVFEMRHLSVLAQLPQFNPDDDGPEPVEAVAALRQDMAWAEGLLISTPEYAHGVPGSLKNALDWLVSGIEVYEKPAVLLNGTVHSTHAQASLRETLSTMSVRAAGGDWVTVPLNGRKLDTSAVLADPQLAGPLRTAIDALVEEMQRRRS